MAGIPIKGTGMMVSPGANAIWMNREEIKIASHKKRKDYRGGAETMKAEHWSRRVRV